MNRHPILDIVAAQVLCVLQYLSSEYKAEIFNRSIVKLARYGLLELKLSSLVKIILQTGKIQVYLPDGYIFLNLHRLFLFGSLHLYSDLGGL